MKTIDISLSTILKIILVPAVLLFTWNNRDILFSLFLAFILMSALRPFVIYLHVQKGVKRPIASALVFLTALAIFILVLSTIIPPLIFETIQFIEKLPVTLQSLDPAILRYIRLQEISQYVPDFANQAVNIVSNIFSNSFFVVTTLFFSYYFLVNEHNIDEKISKSVLAKNYSQEKIREWIRIVHVSQARLASWFWGEVTLMTVVGVSSYIAFSVVGLKYALPLAVLAGLLEAVPSIGPIIAAIPAALIGFGQSPITGFAAIASSFIVQQLENNLFVPYIMKKAVGLNPIITMISVVVGLRVGGPLGALLAIPTYVLFESIYVEYLKNRA
ncbi:MAG: AI-2E family transporter [Patescibacteria group bacterium]